MTSGLELVASGFAMAEGPRWCGDRLIVTDIHADAVKQVDGNGVVSTVVELPSSPINAGFLRDGTMLVSGLTAQTLWRFTDAGLGTQVDLRGVSPFDWGDMVIDAQDRIYLANQGISYPCNIPDRIDSRIYLIADGGAPAVVASQFLYANGLAISPDGRQLIVAESFGHSLWRLPIHDDASLGERVLITRFADTDRPDGICCDSDGAIWSANATGRCVVRCTRNGTVTHRISTGEDLAIGCILGGLDGHDLYITTAPTPLRDKARVQRGSAIWKTRVEVPAGGRP